MNLKIIFLVMYILHFLSCDTSTEKKVEKIDIQDTLTPELSYEEVQQMYKDDKSPKYSYNSALGFVGQKEYTFDVDSGKTIVFDMNANNQNVLVSIEKGIDNFTTKKIDSTKTKTIKTLKYNKVSGEYKFEEKTTKQTKYLYKISINQSSNDSTLVEKYKLDVWY